MRTQTMLRTAAVLGLAVVAGLLAVSGTWALWNVSVSAEAGTVQSADLVVEANGDPLLVNGTSTAVTLADPPSTLTPKSPVYATLTLSNHSDASAGLTLQATLGQAGVTSATPGLAGAMVVTSVAGPCPSAPAASSHSFAATSTATVEQGGSQTFCLRMSLPADAPRSLTGGTATVTVPVHVEQVR